MSRRSKRFVFAIVALALLVCTGLACLDLVRYPVVGWLRGEPFYDGMPASYYADYFLGAKQRRLDEAVASLLAHVSTEAAQWWGRSSDREWRRYLIMMQRPEAVPVQRWLARYSNSRLRYEALLALADQGPMAYGALDVVQGGLADENPECRLAAAYALARIDPSREREGVGLLVRALREPGDRLPQHAALVLEILGARNAGPGMRDTVRHLIAFAKEPGGEPLVHATVQRLVWRIDREAALAAELPDPDASPGPWPFENWMLAVVQPDPWPRVVDVLAVRSEVAPWMPFFEAGPKRTLIFVPRPTPRPAAELKRWAPRGE
jgi:hypothetical protein